MREDDPAMRFDAMRAASRHEAAVPVNERRRVLATLGDMVRNNRDAIADAIAADFGGRARAETMMLEVVPTLGAIRQARANVAGWAKDERRHVELTFRPAKAWVRWEPLGVVGIISPWNYPLYLALGPLVGAIAAGNRAMMKPSELTPAFSDLLARMIGATFEPSYIAVATGGVAVAEAFSALPFDHLVFTGSTAIGRKVAVAAAKNLTPVTLELGGKSPVIVAPDYPLAKAARSVAFGKFLNAGQTCIAPDYALVPRGSERAFGEAVLDAARRGYPTLAGNDDYSAMVTPRHADRLRAAIDDARAGGATVLTHGDQTAGGQVAPTVVLDAPADGLLMTEEIFGPVLPVIGYDTLGDAIAFVNARDRPLALYPFTDDSATREAILSSAISGGVTINGTLIHVAQDDLPFGGVGASGIGAYHGRDGFRRLSHARAVYAVGAVNLFERMGPPWGRMAAMTAGFLTKR